LLKASAGSVFLVSAEWIVKSKTHSERLTPILKAERLRLFFEPTRALHDLQFLSGSATGLAAVGARFPMVRTAGLPWRVFHELLSEATPENSQNEALDAKLSY
jgi:dTDP-4-dehydrorhamnose 3,5-epimerase-like enzyme